MLKAINEQKKAMSEQRKEQEAARSDMQNAIDESMRELDRLKDDYHFNFNSEDGDVRIIRRPRSYSPDFMVPPVPDVPVIIGTHTFFGEGEGTSWQFSKSVKDNSFKKEYSFDVEKSARSVSMSINGDCKAGEIRIKVLTPQGKTYSDVVIDEFGNINVRKSFNISENENQDKTGEWKFQINSDKATGYFKISFQTY